MRIKIDALADTIVKELELYTEDVTKGVKEKVTQVAKECKNEIKEKSPKRYGDYKKGWTQKKQFESKNDIRITVYNKTKPQLAHLLEKGHAKVGGGRVQGKPHIEPAEQNAIKKLENKVKVVIKG